MEQEIFSAGVRPGGPATSDEIKLLICHTLTRANEAMSFEQLHEALSEYELVNYFELVASVDSLKATGHIRALNEPDKAELLIATELGNETIRAVDSLLPPSVRERAAAAASRLLRRQRREREVIAELEPCDGGYMARLAIPEDGLSLIEFSVFCPTIDEARLIRRRFLNDPAFIYRGTLALLTGDRDVIGEIFPEKEELF